MLDIMYNVVEVRRPICHSFSLPFCVMWGLTPNISGSRYLSWVKTCSLVHVSDQEKYFGNDKATHGNSKKSFSFDLRYSL